MNACMPFLIFSHNLRPPRGGAELQSVRCQCGKIVCQVENVPDLKGVETTQSRAPAGPAAVILCRHCKRYVVLRFPAVSAIYTVSDPEQVHDRPLAVR